MKQETAKILLETIATALTVALESKSKLLALEKTLKDHNPTLFEAYSKNLEIVLRNPPIAIWPSGFANLQAKLVQE
jgi:hypothetical protein